MVIEGLEKPYGLKNWKKIFSRSNLNQRKCSFLDLDQEIEKETKKNINLLLSHTGKYNEKKFRLIEKNILNEILQKI